MEFVPALNDAKRDQCLLLKFAAKSESFSCESTGEAAKLLRSGGGGGQGFGQGATPRWGGQYLQNMSKMFRQMCLFRGDVGREAGLLNPPRKLHRVGTVGGWPTRATGVCKANFS